MKVERAGEPDKYGKRSLVKIYQSRCSIVKLSSNSLKTLARTSTSASMGNALELVVDSVLLVEISANVEINDKVTVSGISLRVVAKNVRNDVSGKGHHWELGCATWA